MDNRSAEVRLVISTMRTVRLNVSQRGKCNNFVHFDTWRPLRPVTTRPVATVLANFKTFDLFLQSSEGTKVLFLIFYSYIKGIILSAFNSKNSFGTIRFNVKLVPNSSLDLIVNISYLIKNFTI